MAAATAQRTTAARLSTTVVLGMSGGVDSSVSALLLQRAGWNVIGAFMRNWDAADEAGSSSSCTASDDFKAAATVCAQLRIPLHPLDFSAAYWTDVFTPFLDAYAAGATPNPDVECNRSIKFGVFRAAAERLGSAAERTRLPPHPQQQLAVRAADWDADGAGAPPYLAPGRRHHTDAPFFATGHYAQLWPPVPLLLPQLRTDAERWGALPREHWEWGNDGYRDAAAPDGNGPEGPPPPYFAASAVPPPYPKLLSALDPVKDQSDFLSAVPGAALRRVLFPVGGMRKSQVREIATAAGLATAARRDSYGICFVGKRRAGGPGADAAAPGCTGKGGSGGAPVPRDYPNNAAMSTPRGGGGGGAGATAPGGALHGFLSSYLTLSPGPLVDVSNGGAVVGRHVGAETWTCGQRVRLGGAPQALYVVGRGQGQGHPDPGHPFAIDGGWCGDRASLGTAAPEGGPLVTAGVPDSGGAVHPLAQPPPSPRGPAVEGGGPRRPALPPPLEENIAAGCEGGVVGATVHVVAAEAAAAAVDASRLDRARAAPVASQATYPTGEMMPESPFPPSPNTPWGTPLYVGGGPDTHAGPVWGTPLYVVPGRAHPALLFTCMAARWRDCSWVAGEPPPELLRSAANGALRTGAPCLTLSPGSNEAPLHPSTPPIAPVVSTALELAAAAAAPWGAGPSLAVRYRIRHRQEVMGHASLRVMTRTLFEVGQRALVAAGLGQLGGDAHCIGSDLPPPCAQPPPLTAQPPPLTAQPSPLSSWRIGGAPRIAFPAPPWVTPTAPSAAAASQSALPASQAAAAGVAAEREAEAAAAVVAEATAIADNTGARSVHSAAPVGCGNGGTGARPSIHFSVSPTASAPAAAMAQPLPDPSGSGALIASDAGEELLLVAEFRGVQRAVTPGQVITFYSMQRLLPGSGGGKEDATAAGDAADAVSSCREVLGSTPILSGGASLWDRGLPAPAVWIE